MPRPIVILRHIKASPERVFHLFSDFRNAPKHVPGIKALEVLTDGPIGKGTKFCETRIMLGREATETMEVTEFDPPRGLTLGGNSCGMLFSSRFRFRPAAGGTDFEMEMTMRPVTFMARLMSPLAAFMSGPMKKAISADFDALQKHCESVSA